MEMKCLAAVATAMLALGVAHARPCNYDESKIAPYTLEDPLAFADGRKLKGPEEWPERRAGWQEALGRLAQVYFCSG